MKTKIIIIVLMASQLVLCARIENKNGDIDKLGLTKLINENLVYVKGGSFLMGCDEPIQDSCYIEALPRQIITLSDYYIFKYELTYKLYYQITGKYINYDELDSLCPVTSLRYSEVEDFIYTLRQKTGLNYRLPTEAEWEFAARGGIYSKGYQYSGSDILEEVAWYRDNSRGTPHPVGKLKPNELGIYDMSGNAWEYCSDWFAMDSYILMDSINPKGIAKGSNKVVRGSGCLSDRFYEFKNYYRFYDPGMGWYYRPGIRLVISQSDLIE